MNPTPGARSVCTHCGLDIDYRTWMTISPLDPTEGWVHTKTGQTYCSVATPVGSAPTASTQPGGPDEQP